MSGVDLDNVQYRKGAAQSVKQYVGGKLPTAVDAKIDEISKLGGTPLVVAARDGPIPRMPRRSTA
jgi:K+-transporting ATPase ATPase B chain